MKDIFLKIKTTNDQRKKFMNCFPGYCIQTFDDKKENLSLAKCKPAQKWTMEELKNLNIKGAGIYFTPQRYDNERRLKKNCRGINISPFWLILFL